MRVLAIIPARGGSKGVPLKNIKKLNGKHLISYTIDAAKKSKLLNRIIVSTDDKNIAEIASMEGAEVPFVRPKKISGNKATQFQVVKHATDYLKFKKYNSEIVVLLQPTSPFRDVQIIDKAIKMLIETRATCVMSVSLMKQNPFASFLIKGKYLKPFKSDFVKYSLRQKRPKFYYPTGSVYAFMTENLQKYGTIYGPKIKPIVENELNIDIDTNLDFFICEMIARHWSEYEKQIKEF
jgi:CMP-N-acetylneuraminic acid synthetase